MILGGLKTRHYYIDLDNYQEISSAYPLAIPSFELVIDKEG